MGGEEVSQRELLYEDRSYEWGGEGLLRTLMFEWQCEERILGLNQPKAAPLC